MLERVYKLSRGGGGEVHISVVDWHKYKVVLFIEKLNYKNQPVKISDILALWSELADSVRPTTKKKN